MIWILWQYNGAENTWRRLGKYFVHSQAKAQRTKQDNFFKCTKIRHFVVEYDLEQNHEI